MKLAEKAEEILPFLYKLQNIFKYIDHIFGLNFVRKACDPRSCETASAEGAVWVRRM